MRKKISPDQATNSPNERDLAFFPDPKKKDRLDPTKNNHLVQDVWKRLIKAIGQASKLRVFFFISINNKLILRKRPNPRLLSKYERRQGGKFFGHNVLRETIFGKCL